jgi:hypothetical protein
MVDEMSEGPPEMGIAITGDPDGNPVIAYMNSHEDLAPADLMVARPNIALGPNITPNCGPGTSPSWYCQIIDRGTPYSDYAGAASIVVDSAGFAMIAYHEQDNYEKPDGNLKLAYQRLLLYLPIILR